MPTYPLDFPSKGARSYTLSLANAVSSSISPFTGEEQVYAFPGQWWQGDITFATTTGVNAGEIRGFLSALRGQFGTFTFSPSPGPNGLGGTINVDGGSQLGRTLNLKDMTASSTIAKSGDYFQLGTNLYQFTADLVSDAGGLGTAEFEPSLRTSPADSAGIITTAPQGVFRLSENTTEHRIGEAYIQDATISFREDI